MNTMNSKTAFVNALIGTIFFGIVFYGWILPKSKYKCDCKHKTINYIGVNKSDERLMDKYIYVVRPKYGKTKDVVVTPEEFEKWECLEHTY